MSLFLSSIILFQGGLIPQLTKEEVEAIRNSKDSVQLASEECDDELLSNFALYDNARQAFKFNWFDDGLFVYGPTTTFYFVEVKNNPARPYNIYMVSELAVSEAVFKAAFVKAFKSKIPVKTCEKRYRDHNDYGMEVKESGIRGWNTVTLQKYSCTDWWKTKTFKTTITVDFNITANFDADQKEIEIRADIGGEYMKRMRFSDSFDLIQYVQKFDFEVPRSGGKKPLRINWDSFDHEPLRFKKERDGNIRVYVKSRLMETEGGVRRPFQKRDGESCQVLKAMQSNLLNVKDQKYSLFRKKLIGGLP